MADQRISLSEAARRSGVPTSTLKRWAAEKIVPVRRGGRAGRGAPPGRGGGGVVARMRERGCSLEDLREAGREGRLAFGFTEELFPTPAETLSVEEVAAETG